MSDNEQRTDRLIFLKAIGMWIDPRTIAAVQAVAYWKQDARHKGCVVLETRAGNTYKMPCVDVLGAEKFRDSLASIANHRGRYVRKEPNAVDYRGAPLSVDDQVRAS